MAFWLLGGSNAEMASTLLCREKSGMGGAEERWCQRASEARASTEAGLISDSRELCLQPSNLYLLAIPLSKPPFIRHVFSC